jgi:IS5 family transposase
MLRLKGHQNQVTLWDLVLPVDLLELPEELAKVDQWLDDERFFKPYLEKFNQRLGRPSVPVETFLRLLYLRHRHGLSYEVLVQEVRDSYTWRKFCRIGPHQRVPDSSTLVKLVKKYGPDTLDQLNEELLHKAREKKVIRGHKLRMDTTVIESDIHHPTDAGLLADGVRIITRIVHQLKQAGAEVSARFRDQTRAVKKQILTIGKVLQRRTGEAQADVAKATKEILGIARRTVAGAKAIAHQVTAVGSELGQIVSKKVQRLAAQLRAAADLTEKVVEQTKQVLAGNRHIPDRVVSLADPDARPIKKGKLKSPTEFGYKVVIQETEERLVTGYEVRKGNPSDHSLIPDAIERHKKVFRRAPKQVAADRGFGTAKSDRYLAEQGVKQVAIPRPGKISEAQRAYQSQRWFRGLQRWRAGAEGTISLLKRKYGMRRTRLRGFDGARCTVAGAVWAHNLTRLVTMK